MYVQIRRNPSSTDLAQVRTLTFRFTNIHDAVMFKSTLHKSNEWAGSNIQFAQDPCEKANGIHFD